MSFPSLPVLLAAFALVPTPASKPKATSQPKSAATARQAKPTPSKRDTAGFQALSEPALRQALAAMGEPVVLTRKQQEPLRVLVAKLKAGDDAGALEAWARLVKRRHASGHGDDLMALVGLALRQAHLDTTAALADKAEAVAFYNELKKALREDLQRLRDAIADARDQGAELVRVRVTIVRTAYAPGRHPVLGTKEIELTLAQAEAKLDRDARNLQSVGDDAQLANLDLQDALQKQQQALQMMSNIAKSMHDTAQSVICKLGEC